jgi:ComF family protein
VIPIPLSAQKMRYRGFNQAEIIASIFAKGYGLSMQNSILSRQRDTVSQHRLNKEERLENMKDAFSVPPSVANRSFILVDDICTTGATLIEAANVFYKAGAAEVTAFTLSKRL